jgi:TPR repeat protein
MFNLKINLSENSFLFPALCFLALLICNGVWCNGAWAASYEEGKQAYLAKDYQAALAILKPLAEIGDSQAQVTLGIMYDFGHGVSKDPAEAIKWYIKAAEQGIPVVQHDVGVKYFEGQGVDKDYLKAAYWWEQSANAGLADSQFNLGLLYYRGIGLEIDYKKASSLFTSAAEQDHPHAQYSLAVMYAFGQGLDKNYEQALQWFRKSAAHHVTQAQFNLGVFYENGYGLEKDLATAKKWFGLAAKGGLTEAKSKLSELEQAGDNTVQHPDVTDLVVNQPDKVSPVPPRDNNIRREDWVRQQSGESYTLQLSSMLEEKDIVNFIQKHKLTPNAAYIEVVIKGTTRYNALYGSYTTYEEAKKAAASLTGSLGKNKPWVRNFGILQGLIK